MMRTIPILAVSFAALLANAHAAPPPNDHFASASVETGAFWLAQGTLHGATSETNEPVLTGSTNGPTVWWRWTAPSAGSVRVRTWGSENENMVAVYRGATLDTTRLVASGSSYNERARSAEALFSATAGETYSIQVLGAEYSATGAVVFDPFLPSRLQVSLTYAPGFAAAPVNNAFASPLALAGASADVVVNTSGATSEPGEPLDIPDARGNTVWLSWTAPSSGTWQVDAQQGDHDSAVAVYTGASVNALTRLDFSSDAFSKAGNPWVGGGRVTFRANAGTSYRLQVQGTSLPGEELDYGNVRVLLQAAVAPANDDFAAAIVLAGTAPSADGWSTFATRETAEAPAAPDESRSVWWKWTAAQSGLLAVIQYEGNIDAYTGTALGNLVALPLAPNAARRESLGGVTDWFTVTAGATVWLRGTAGFDRVIFGLRNVPGPANDDFANRTALSGATTGALVDGEYASWENNEPDTDALGPKSVWYRWTAPASGRYVIDSKGSPSFTRVKVFTGGALAALATAGSEMLYGFAPNAYGRVILDATAGTEYAIRLQRPQFITGLDHLNIRAASPPANDNFSSARVMVGSAWSDTGTNLDATFEANEPLTTLSDAPTLASVWWRWTAPASGLYRLSTVGSSVDTVLVVYTGASIGGLTRVAQNQADGWGSTGALTFAATAGTTYQIQVDGQARTEGPLQLALASVTAPPNNQFASRLSLSGVGGLAGGTVLGATTEAGEPVIPGATVGRSVWYEWAAPASGNAFFRVVAQRFTPAFGLYAGNSLAALTPLVTSGSGAPSATEQTFLIAYPVSAGSNYKILIDGAPATNGEFRVSVTMPASPPNDHFAARFALQGAIVHSSATNEGATREANEPSHAGSSPNASVWWEWTAPAAGPVLVDTSGSIGQARLAVYTGTALNALTSVASDTVVFPETFSALGFTASAGTKYVIAADGNDRLRGPLALNILSGAAFAPNDAFANATAWSGDQAEDIVRPLGATAEPGEPAHGGRPAARSLWWAWTPSTSRRAWVWMETENAGFLARLAVYKGGALNSLTPQRVATTDGHRQRLQVDVLAGETYYLAVDTPAITVDPGWLRVGVVPVSGTQENAAPIAPEDGVVSANTEGGFNEDPMLAPSARRELWWHWTPDHNARMEWRVAAPKGDLVSASASVTSSVGSFAGQVVPSSDEILVTFDAEAGVTYFLRANTATPATFTVRLLETERQVPPANNVAYQAFPMSGPAWSTPVTLGAETEDRLWWTWTAPLAGVAQITLNGTLAEADALYAFADGGAEMTAGTSRTNGGPPQLRIASQAGQQWTIVTRTSLRRLRGATLALVSPAPGTAPANDSWLTPQLLGPSWTGASGDVTFASCQPDEPDHSASNGTQVATKFPPGRSVWFDWTPASTGMVTLRLDSSAPLAMRVYRGRTRAEWLEEAFLASGSAVLPALVVAGQSYHIAVATRPYDEFTAPFTLSLGSAAPNDLLAAATVLSGSFASGTTDSAGATVEPGEPGNGFNADATRASLWWKWTAPASGLVRVDTLGSAFDTILAVFLSDPPDLSARVAENDNATSRPGVTASALVFPATSGQTYLLRISRKETSEAAGLARLNLTMSPPPEPYERWLATWPTLSGAAALATADDDRDGMTNLEEVAFGGSPLVSDGHHRAPRIYPDPGGWRLETALDRDALESLYQGTSLEIGWQLSTDLKTWQAGPPSQFVRRDGRFSIEQIVLKPGDPPYARMVIRKLR